MLKGEEPGTVTQGIAAYAQLFCGTGWSDPVPVGSFHWLKSIAIHGALFR